MTEDELIKVVRTAVREEFSAAGMRVDEPEDQDAARRDFMFLRAFRLGIHSLAAKIGMAVIIAFGSGIMWVLVAGINAWKAKS